MRKIILFMLLFSFSLFAQSGEEARALLQKQIEKAQEKQKAEQVKMDREEWAKESGKMGSIVNKEIPEVKPVPKPVQTASVKKDDVKQAKNPAVVVKQREVLSAESRASGSSWKVYFLGTVSIVVFSFVFIRRKLMVKAAPAPSALPVKSIKNNIRILRSEKIIKKEWPELKQVRTKLINSSAVANNQGRPLHAVARELKIAQGELLLAAKIKSFQVNRNENEKWFLN